MPTSYRFLPWARRGLAAALPTGSGPMAQRPEIEVRVQIAGAGEARTKALLHGPGDVIGIEQGQVLRCYPRPGATDAEPNYLAAIDLDAPELPWLFTPRGAAPGERLAPWMVLVVVEALPGVTITSPRGAPLPQLHIPSGAAAQLPDLKDSWAWAHVQLVEPSGTGPVEEALGSDPNRNVARLICPRRLLPGRRWIAALVPAFEAGRMRGMGRTPPEGSLAPAWTADANDVTLPVYYHWEFQSGPEGDFEALAQRLKPHKVDTMVGLMPMHVGEAAPPLRVPANQARSLFMDGALRAPAQSDGTLGEVPAALRDGLQEVTRTLADAADGKLDGQILADASRQPVGPPIYASSHVKRWQVGDGDALWLRELNLDPRPRVAAGLGTDCVRENQEDIVNAAWRQVGDVMAAEAALQRAALSSLAAQSWFRRHLQPMTPDRLVQIAAPVAARLPWQGTSLTAQVRRSSLPNAVLDAGLRRTLAPSGRAVAQAARRLSIPVSQIRTSLVASLAEGHETLDPTRFARPALTGLSPQSIATGNLDALRLPVAVDDGALTLLLNSARKLADQPPVPPADRLTLRPEARKEGLVGQVHVDAARQLAKTALESGAATIEAASSTLLDGIVTGASQAIAVNPRAGAGVGLVLEVSAAGAGGLTPDSVQVGILDLDAGGVLVRRNPAGAANEPLAVLDPALAGQNLGAFLSRLPVNALRRAAPAQAPSRAELPQLQPGRGLSAGLSQMRRVSPAPDTVGLSQGVGAAPVLRNSPALEGGAAISTGLGSRRPDITVLPDPVVIVPVEQPPGRPVILTPPLLRDPLVIARFEEALALHARTSAITSPLIVATTVRFDLSAAGSAIRSHVDPRVAQPLRRDAILRFGGQSLSALRADALDMKGWRAAPALDRVMAYPTFPVAAADYLAQYDRNRFCPGVNAIPANSVTLLETNPRFIAAFMAGLNHETNRELLWRGFPTDSRGTPFRRFWRRLDGKDDIPPIHSWGADSLAEQTIDPKGNIVLLVRGDLLRRYPNTIAVALPALSDRAPDHANVVKPIFEGQFEPDISFFGFPLVDTQLTQGAGWFFGLMEPVTEPRFGLDETVGDPPGGGAAGASDALAWPSVGVSGGEHLTRAHFSALGLNAAAAGSDDLAAKLFQRPFALYVHARHITTTVPLPVQQ